MRTDKNKISVTGGISYFDYEIIETSKNKIHSEEIKKTFCFKKNKYSLIGLGATIKALVVISLLFATSVEAQEKVEHEHEADKNHEFIVIGIANIPEFEGSKDTMTIPFIVSNFSMFGAETIIEGLQGQVNIVKNSMWRAGPALSISTGRNADVKSVEISELPEIDAALELGAFVGFHSPFSNMKEGALSGLISMRQDITGNHGGLLVTGKLEYFFAANRRLRFGAGINTTYANNDYMDTYFSIDSSGEFASGLKTFQAGAGLKDVGIEMYSNISINQKWSIFSRFSYNRLLKDAANSPIVDTAGSVNQYVFGAGIFYRF